MLRVLERSEDIRQTQDAFAKIVENVSNERIRTRIKFRGGPHEDWVFWIPSVDIWAHFGLPPSQKANKNRYWNVFGVGRPGNSMRIICEINSPFEGINRRIGGAYAISDDGRRFILHRGNFRGGGLTQKDFLSHYPEQKIHALDGDRHSIFVQVLQLGSPTVLSDLARFIHEVGGMKGLI